MMEVENDGSGPDSTLEQLVQALNKAGPVRDFQWLDTGEKLTPRHRFRIAFDNGKAAIRFVVA